MKNMTMRWTIVAAALAVAAGSAAAQTYKADIPMAFRVGGRALQAGTYEFAVNYAAGSPFVQVRNMATLDAVLVMPLAGHDAPIAWRKIGNPVVSFDCARTCTLKELWTARDVTTVKFPMLKLPKSESQRAASEVTFALVKTD